jgi:endonuclease/exonuclease/phosphatase family metal-dependent hydrolase
VIEASGADLVALQEVSRGWLVDGSTDLPAWLSRRLDMPFIFRGTSDPVWGNAMLSRDPLLAAGWAPLPRSGTLLPRGFLWAELDVGQAEPLLVIATHLHHVESEHAPRQAQVAALLSFWGGRPNSLLLGDLNARPEYTEMGLIAEAGWTDSWREAGEGAGLTWPAVDPFERIDWIWHTDDLTAVDATVIDSAASDHRPVLATIDTAP